MTEFKSIPKSLVVLDFDDTLVVTSKNKFVNYDQWRELDEVLTNLYHTLHDVGHVVIVTNANIQHIRDFCKLRLPKFKSFLSERSVYSARETYSKHYPGKPSIWKILMVHLVVRMLYPDESQLYQVLGIGDKPWDREAVLYIKEKIPHIIVKSIKMVELPSASDMKSQHEYLIDNVLSLANTSYSLDYHLHTKIDQNKSGYV